MKFHGTAVLFLRTVIGRAYPRMVGLQREKSWLVFDVLLPLLQVSAYVFIYRAVQAPPEFTGFVVLGGAMTAYWMNVLWNMASQLYWEKETGNLEVFMVAPTSRMAILLGMALGGIVATTVRAAAVLFLGIVLFRVQLAPTDIPMLVGVFFLTLIALYGMGMLLSSLYLLFGREAWHISNLLQEPVYLLSGLYFPVRSLGAWAAAGASLIPMTLGLDAMRQLMFPEMTEFAFLPVRYELAILGGLSVLFVVAARWALAYMEELARRQGRLTVRGQ